MLIFIKKSGFLFDLERDRLQIVPGEEERTYEVRWADPFDSEGPFSIDLTHEELQVFIETLESSLRRKVPVMVFDQDNLMTLAMQNYMKGGTPREEAPPPMSMDVDLE